MNIVLIGAGRIGSTIAFHLAKAGHQITVVARGTRLEALSRECAIVTTDGRRAPISVVASLDSTLPYDLAIVTAPEHQVAPLLPVVAASGAKTILFMFNTFQGPERYRSAVGVGRFAFGFPNMAAYLVGDRLRFRIDGSGMVTMLTSPDLAMLFKRAGMPSEVEADMDAYLRTHVALAVPLFLAALLTWQRKTNLTWTEARQLNAAWTEGFDLVRSLGHSLKPRIVAGLARMPHLPRTALLWLFSRSRAVKDVGEFGPTETRCLIDSMAAAAPDRASHLLSLRP